MINIQLLTVEEAKKKVGKVREEEKKGKIRLTGVKQKQFRKLEKLIKSEIIRKRLVHYGFGLITIAEGQ